MHNLAASRLFWTPRSRTMRERCSMAKELQIKLSRGHPHLRWQLPSICHSCCSQRHAFWCAHRASPAIPCATFLWCGPMTISFEFVFTETLMGGGETLYLRRHPLACCLAGATCCMHTDTLCGDRVQQDIEGPWRRSMFTAVEGAQSRRALHLWQWCALNSARECSDSISPYIGLAAP